MRRERWWDLGLTGLVLFAQSAPFLVTQPEQGGGWPLTAWLPVLLSALPVLVRRRWPATCLLLSAVGVGLYGLADTAPAQPIWYGPLICMYAVAYQSSRAIRIASLAVTALGMLVAINSLNTAVRELSTWSAAYALGALARARRETAEAAERQAAELAAERERARIAQDLHDILGHAFSLMVVQAEAGGAVARSDPDRAERAFDAISAAGRDAMTQLRTTVGALREAERAPQPTLADLPELLRQVEQAGLTARLVEHGPRRPVPAQVQLAAYRLVQEATTNVVKHAGAASVEVALDWRPGELAVTVTDDGRGAADRRPAGGHGLTGIAERVAAAGGKVVFGPAPAGGFRVEAVFG
ncbi:sensor histidine kinase [Catellatospora sp. NPDC049609]|uniref:sensor histidine kinase n=1 Tax=Catellatospora sp. NPDC049609 TaxID=3155505 RepID=UPI003447C109